MLTYLVKDLKVCRMRINYLSNTLPVDIEHVIARPPSIG
jgi:hypothetical protein